MASPGSQAAGREAAKRDRSGNERTGGGQLVGAGSTVATSASQRQTSTYDAGALSNVGTKGGTTAADVERANRLGNNGKSTGSGGGTQMGPEGPANPSSSAAPSATTTTPQGPTYAPNGRPLTDGTIQTYDNPSLGQLVSAFTRAPISPFGVVSTLASIANSDQYGRDLLGQSIDAENGGTPDAGYQGPNHIASNTDARGDRPSDDTRLMDRASTAARDAIGGAPDEAGAVGDDGGAEFSPVRLQDRRRPYNDVGAVDLLQGLL